jgi:hypothetical protein
MAVKEPTGDLKKACWKGYTAVGMKMKNGRKVPNCVPANEEREIPLSHRTKHDVSHYRVLNNGRDVSKHDSYEEAIAHAGEHRRRLKSKGYDADKISVHAYVKEEKENYGLPAHSMKHVMQKIKDGHWEVSSGEVKSGQHLSIIDHTKGKKRRMIHVKEESNEPKDREWGTTKLTKRYKKDTPGQCDCDTMKEEAVGRKRYKVGLTISHRDVASGNKKDVRVNVNASSQQKAIETAEKHYRNAGYKVHKDLSFIHSVNEESDQMDEAATSDNPHYGYHGTQEKDADKKYSAMHTRVKKVVGAAGHLGDVKKPNVVVRHYLDSVRGRHAAGRSDGYIARDFAKFKKTYKPEMHEEAGQMDESHKVGDLVSYYHDGLRDHVYGIVQSVRDDHITMKTGGQTRAVPMKMVQKADKNKVPKYRYMNESDQLDEGMTKAINKKMKNTLSAMRGRESLGAPEKGLSWQQNKAKAIKAGRAMAKEEIEQIDELSNETLKSYIQKVAADSQKHPQNPSKRPPEKASRSVAGFDKAYQKLAREEVEQISEGPQRDATRAKNKLRDAIAGANYKRTGAPVPDAEPQHKTAQAHNKAIGRSLRKMEEGTRDLTAALTKRIEKKTGGKETAVRNKAGLLVTKKKSKDKFEEAFKLSPKNSLKYREHKHEYEREEQIKNRPSYQGYHTQIHVDGRHYKAGDRMGAGEKGAQDAGRHAANIAKKTGKKVSLHMIHHETGKTLAIADHTDGKWKYRNLSEAAPIQKQPKAGVEKLVSKMNPDTKANSVNETRNIIREVIKKAVDKQETNKANGKTATGEPAPKIKIDPVIDLGTNNRGIGGT